MTLAEAFVKFKITDEIIKKLNEQLYKIVNSRDLTQMEIEIPYDEVEVPEYEPSQIQDAKEMWEDIAKLSIDLIIDYKHYSQFLFESRYTKTEYDLSLVNLGFVLKNGLWKSDRKPELKEVQTTMMMYFLHSIISDKMAFKADNEVNEENERRRLELNINPENLDRFVEIVAHDNDICETINCQFFKSENSKGNEMCNICSGEIRHVAVTNIGYNLSTLNGNGDVAARVRVIDYDDIQSLGNDNVGDNIDRENCRDREECGGLCNVVAAAVKVGNVLESNIEDTRIDFIEGRKSDKKYGSKHGSKRRRRHVKTNKRREEKKEILERREIVNEERVPMTVTCDNLCTLNGNVDVATRECLTYYGNIRSLRNASINRNKGDKAGKCSGENDRDGAKCCGLTVEVRGDNGLESTSEDTRTDLIGRRKHGGKLSRRDVKTNEGGKPKKEIEDILEGKELANEDVVNKWRCSACTLLNKYELGNCDACGNLFQDGSWVCNRCKRENTCNMEKCLNCKYMNDKMKKISDDIWRNEGSKENSGNEGNRGYEDVRGGVDEYNTVVYGQLDYNNVIHKFCRHMYKGCGGKDCISNWDLYVELGFFNKYTFDTCEACAALLRWTCGSCKKVNSHVDDHCSECHRRNDNRSMEGYVNNIGGIRQDHNSKYPSVKDDKSGGFGATWDVDKDGDIADEHWGCLNCQLRQSYRNIDCYVCGCSRLDMGLWKCHKCTMVNKCDCERCVTCGTWSKYLPEKYCIDCQISRVVGTEVRCELCVRDMNIDWKCRYKSCRGMNKGTEKYCSNCGLWRYNPFGRGVECQRWTGYVLESVWVCQRCNSVNPVNVSRCEYSKWSGVCLWTRYEPMYCEKCHSYSDGTSDHCYYCQIKCVSRDTVSDW